VKDANEPLCLTNTDIFAIFSSGWKRHITAVVSIYGNIAALPSVV